MAWLNETVTNWKERDSILGKDQDGQASKKRNTSAGGSVSRDKPKGHSSSDYRASAGAGAGSSLASKSVRGIDHAFMSVSMEDFSDDDEDDLAFLAHVREVGTVQSQSTGGKSAVAGASKPPVIPYRKEGNKMATVQGKLKSFEISYTSTHTPCQLCMIKDGERVSNAHKPSCFTGKCFNCNMYGHTGKMCEYKASA